MKHPSPGRAILVAMLVAAMSSSCRTDSSNAEASELHVEQVRIGEILWYVHYDAALAIAREQDKALWVHFGENPG